MPSGVFALSKFVAANPPAGHVVPAPRELIDAFDGHLPASLLDLWRRHGLGRYGPQQICIIDPRVWQATLDRWIVSPPDTAQRIPIALTPFGSIIYYRRLTVADEDVAVLNPHSRSTDVLAWDLDAFFNEVLCDTKQLDQLIPQGWLAAARATHGDLADDEAYEADATLLAMEMLVLKCVEALDMHKRLRDAVDAPAELSRDEAVPMPLGEALPGEWRTVFEPANRYRDVSTSPVTGLYLSSDVDRHRLLALATDKTYQLLFFSSDRNPRYQFAPRHYSGAYALAISPDGEKKLTLDIRLRDNSLGSDANDDELTILENGGMRVLLRTGSLKDIADAIHWNSTIRDPQNWLVQTSLADNLPHEFPYVLPAPPLRELPPSLSALVHREPFKVTVAGIEPRSDEDSVQVQIRLGRDNGLRSDMPFCSIPSSQKHLMGWVSGLEAGHCKIRLSQDSETPEIGDVLVSRDPDAGPLR